MLTYLSFCSKGRKIVTEGGSIQKFMIPNITNVDDDPIFSVSGDIAMNWRYYDNGVRIALTGGYLSDENSNGNNTHGLGLHLWLKVNEKAEEDQPNWKIEILNIQDCLNRSCSPKNLIVQGKNHGNGPKSGPVYGNYAIYASNSSTVKFPTDQKLDLKMKSKKINFMIVLRCLLKSGEKPFPSFFPKVSMAFSQASLFGSFI